MINVDELIKKKDDLNDEIRKLQAARNSLIDLIQNSCLHEDIADLTETNGKHMDNGYGHWWRGPYFKCIKCGLVDESYDAKKLIKERNVRKKKS